MKKRSEGYALPFVLVVMVVLCLSAASLLTMAESNLKIQQRSIERMQDKYEAAGAIEIVMAELSNLKTAEGENEQDAIQNEIIDICSSVYKDEKGPIPAFQDSASPAAETDDEGNFFECLFTVTSQYDSVSVVCEMKLTGKIKQSETEKHYSISSPEVTYMSYEVRGSE